MRTILEIYKELDNLKEKRNKIEFGNEFWPITKEEIESTIILFYDVKNIFERNNAEDAEQIIKKKRRAIIQELNTLKMVMNSGGIARQYDIQHHYLIEELRFLNWILERDSFDRNIWI